MIKNNYYKNLLLEAISKDELSAFLEGKGKYHIKCNVADTPTDFGSVLDTAFYLADTNPELNIGRKFECAIKNMLQGNECDIYCSVFLFFSYIIQSCRILPINYNEKDMYYRIASRKKLNTTFSLPIDEISKVMTNSLHRNQESLKSCKKWTGKNKSEGIWEEVERLNNIMKKDYNIEIL